MTIKITHLDVRAKVSENDSYGGPVPYAIVNCTWKFLPSEEEHDIQMKNMAIAEAEDYRSILTLDDPKRYEHWIATECDFSLEKRYDGWGKRWTHNDLVWTYFEKFDTFQFFEFIAWTTATKAILNELFYYKSTGEFMDLYRCTPDSVVLHHIRALSTYWD